MRHENRVKCLFPTFLIVISCSHLACSQAFRPGNTLNEPSIINNAANYKNSIAVDSTHQLVLIQQFVPQLIIDLKYATINNFTGVILYKKTAAYCLIEAAIALRKITSEFNKIGLTLKIFDSYRPHSVTKKMWKLVHDEKYVANPVKGSGHNRGAAVDVTLVDLSTGKEVEMPTSFDDFSIKAHHSYLATSETAIENRRLLKSIMEKHGFLSLRTEWWHYSLPDAASRYPLLDLSFEQLELMSAHR